MAKLCLGEWRRWHARASLATAVGAALATLGATHARAAETSVPSSATQRAQGSFAPLRTFADLGYEPSSRRDRANGLLGPLRVGPLVGFGLPNLINFGVTLKLTRYFGAGVNVGLIPTLKLANYGDAKVSYQEYDIYGRIYPFGGGFFVGTGVGYASAKGKYTTTTDISDYAAQFPELDLPLSLRSTSRGSVEAMVLTPQIGYFQIFRGGFCVGVDIGAQIPIAPGKIDVSTGVPDEVPDEIVQRYVTPGQREVRDTLESVARTPVPTFNLRLGWML